MKKYLLSSLFFFSVCITVAQEKKLLYNPQSKVELDMERVVAQASKENKHILLIGGGNWCSWCYLFEDFIKKDPQIDSLINKDYVVYHLNYSKENLNEASFTQLEFPQRFGFPVFIILNENGKRIHTQNSALLEEGKGYNKNKVFEFLSQWNRNSLNPASYKRS